MKAGGSGIMLRQSTDDNGNVLCYCYCGAVMKDMPASWVGHRAPTCPRLVCRALGEANGEVYAPDQFRHRGYPKKRTH